MKPGEAVKFNQTQFKSKDLEAYLNNIKGTYAQHHVHGMKNRELASGADIQVDAISTAASSTKIARDYTAAEEFKKADSTKIAIDTTSRVQNLQGNVFCKRDTRKSAVSRLQDGWISAL